MKKLLILPTVLILVSLACGGSSNNNTPSDEDAIATEIAAGILATQEAESQNDTSSNSNSGGSDTGSSSAPVSGEVLYSTDFSDFDQYWYMFTRDDVSNYTIEQRSRGLYVQLPDANDYVFAYVTVDYGDSDVELEANVELLGGTNYTYIELICRSSNIGEYVFFLDTGGYWQIGKKDFEAGEYSQLGYGGTTAIRAGKKENNMKATCIGDELTFYINGQEVGSATDFDFTTGDIGVGVQTQDIAESEVMIHDFTVVYP